ncbi:subtilisin-like protein [Coniophora puteana RWD-64-598 SS2]|uniref:tripeptidyl-peptidase II n=1 Tax=Coniophora puteana (strain RWD-64-598) TaxID=741705 RepID=A0A5M3MUM3_CONPW|nr:subtilisin-like protein [Coniophora puteana RWD-64-598 SS2]EIW82301.1 subtilisin-like protein [Coniophora puteana RWD-64-598 SS2]
MRSLLVSLVSLALALSVLAEPTLSPYTLHEKRDAIPAGWSRDRKYHATASVPLRFALAQNNIDSIGDLLLDISHPESENYGKHWTAAQVAAKFAPSATSVDAVRTWLEQSGVEPHRITITPSKGWIEVSSTVEEAESLLQTDYHVYGHESGAEQIACEGYHLPAHVAPHVDFVTPTVHFDAKIKRVKRDGHHAAIPIGQPGFGAGPKTSGVLDNIFTQLEDCDKQITPACLRALYGIVYDPVSTNNSYGIVEYTPQAYIQSDLDSFAKNFSTGLEGVSPKLVSIDGGVDQTSLKNFSYNGESNLDLQYGMTLVTAKQPVTLYQVGDMNLGASFNNFLDALDGSYCAFEGGDDPSQDGIYPDNVPGGYDHSQDCGTVKPANVISTSYGYNEADLTAKYAQRQCAEYAKLGMMGVTVLYSSGDYGVAGNGDLCLDSNGNQTADGKIFNPSFPSTCPYVTSVGATQVSPGQTVLDRENACQQVIYSGGGFSNYFAVPDYQKAVVAGYLENHPPPYSKTTYNTTGTSRAYPDISANGANYVVAINGNYSLVYGTSASSPVVGAIITLINDARIAMGKSPVGFINPTIYSSEFQYAWNDVTNGTNPGCGTVGFSSAPGWDPVTGLGTPNFPALLAKWLDL